MSSQISTLTHAIQNSRDNLLDELNETYKSIICEFNNLTVEYYKDQSLIQENAI